MTVGEAQAEVVSAAPVEQHPLYGLLAEFEEPEQVLQAAHRAYKVGYRRMDAYTPFPIEGLSDALGQRDMHVPHIMLAAGIGGAVLGFGMIYFCQVMDYPMNIGGKPLLSWPTFIPITFEMTVLLSALAGIVGMFALNGLPMPYHPLFAARNFEQATNDRFFLCIEATDPKFDREATREFLESLGPARVSEVEDRK